MPNFKGEVTFKVTFNNVYCHTGYGVTTAVIQTKCAEAVYAQAPFSKIKDRKSPFFKVEVIESKIF